MKFNRNYLPHTAATLGIAAAAARLGLYAFGVDEKGLLISGHPLSLLVWAVTAFSAVFFCLSVRKLGGSEVYEDNFTPSVTATAGNLVFAAGITVTVLSAWETWMRLEMIRNFLGLLCIPMLLVIALYRMKGAKPFFLPCALPCLYLTLHTVSHYQIWCSRPQIQDFFFPMAASICLALFSYYQTAFSVDFGKRQMVLLTGLTGIFACLAAMAGGEDLWLYLSGAVWMITNLCSLTPMPKPEPEKKEE